jgi:hypothetical protein
MEGMMAHKVEAKLVEEYPCHYCGDFFPATEDHERPVRSHYDNGLDTILVCDKPTCQARYAHRINAEGLAIVVQKVAK